MTAQIGAPHRAAAIPPPGGPGGPDLPLTPVIPAVPAPSLGFESPFRNSLKSLPAEWLSLEHALESALAHVMESQAAQLEALKRYLDKLSAQVRNAANLGMLLSVTSEVGRWIDDLTGRMETQVRTEVTAYGASPRVLASTHSYVAGRLLERLGPELQSLVKSIADAGHRLGLPGVSLGLRVGLVDMGVTIQ